MHLQSYPRKLAYEYLEELANEFGRLYGAQVDAVARPYAFIKFGGQCSPDQNGKVYPDHLRSCAAACTHPVAGLGAAAERSSGSNKPILDMMLELILL